MESLRSVMPGKAYWKDEYTVSLSVNVCKTGMYTYKNRNKVLFKKIKSDCLWKETFILLYLKF